MFVISMGKDVGTLSGVSHVLSLHHERKMVEYLEGLRAEAENVKEDEDGGCRS